ncbi:MAG TPA: hypothetical protein VHG91_17080 [Longimicrobium sp.]|nr:hypothetical protein [Longimicrobium sp.]
MTGPASSSAPAAAAPEGRVFTFYSYKGGTGRSMTLANVAWILASNGKRVLTVDWDLEAPGLHRYFAPFLLDTELTATPGLMDLLVDFAAETVSGSAEAAPDWHHEHAARVLRYVVSLEWDFPGGGRLDLLPAGRQGPQYAPLVNGFDWQRFYDRQGGGSFVEAVRDRLRGLYDYVLVDSRTGVSDTAGICTVQLPDTLVTCFTLNNQGVEGAAAVAASAFQQREKAGRPLQVLPVPMRIENAENGKLQARWEIAKRRLAPFPVLEGVDRDRYWSEVAMVYKPFYAYEEVLATFGDRPSDPIPLLPSAERLAGYLTDGAVTRLVPPDEAGRVRVLAQYAGRPAEGAAAGPDQENADAEAVFARLTAEQQEAARRLFTRLVEVIPPEEGGGARRVRLPESGLDEATRGVAAALLDAGLLSAAGDAASGTRALEVARESLPSSWQRLREWLEKDRVFLAWRRRLAAPVAEWEAGGRREGTLLLRDVRAQVASTFLQGREAELTPGELAYIRASVAADARRRRTRWVQAASWSLAVASLFLAALVVSNEPVRRWFGLAPIPSGPAIVADSLPAVRAALVADADRLSDQGVYDRALVLLDSAVALDSTSAEIFVSRGYTRLRSGDAAWAGQDFDRAVALDPRAPEGYVGQAETKLANADTAGAIVTLRTAYALVAVPEQQSALAQRLQELGTRPVDRSIEVLGYTGSRSDSVWLRDVAQELDRAGYPLARPWTPARNTVAQVRYFRDDRRAVADSVAAAVQRSLDRQAIPIRIQVVQRDSLRYRAPAGSVTVWLPPMEPRRAGTAGEPKAPAAARPRS